MSYQQEVYAKHELGMHIRSKAWSDAFFEACAEVESLRAALARSKRNEQSIESVRQERDEYFVDMQSMRATIASLQSETASLRALVVKKDVALREVLASSDGGLPPTLSSLDYCDATLRLTPSDLADCVVVKREEWERINMERNGFEGMAEAGVDGRTFYMGIVHRVGNLFGIAARTSDDGSIQEDVLALKVPELVSELQSKLAASEAALAEAREELAEDTKLREKMADILTRTANALKGPPAKLSLHSWHDLPGVAAAARAREAALREALKDAINAIESAPEVGQAVITEERIEAWKKSLAAQEAKPE